MAKKLAYKHKMTVYLRDRSLEGSFCPTGKWYSGKKSSDDFQELEFRRFLCILSVAVKKLLYEKYSKPHRTLDSARIVSNLYKLDQFILTFDSQLLTASKPVRASVFSAFVFSQACNHSNTRTA